MAFINSFNKYLLGAYYESGSILDTVGESMKKITKVYFILELETGRGRINIGQFVVLLWINIRLPGKALFE